MDETRADADACPIYSEEFFTILLVGRRKDVAKDQRQGVSWVLVIQSHPGAILSRASVGKSHKIWSTVNSSRLGLQPQLAARRRPCDVAANGVRRAGISLESGDVQTCEHVRTRHRGQGVKVED
jgi:hypothetical protein